MADPRHFATIGIAQGVHDRAMGTGTASVQGLKRPVHCKLSPCRVTTIEVAFSSGNTRLGACWRYKVKALLQ